MRKSTAVALGALLAAVGCTRPAPEKEPCAPGTRCPNVDKTGRETPNGDYRAQCASTYPDYIVPAKLFPAGYAGPWFSLETDFPNEPVPAEELPWSNIDFQKGVKEADAYLYALRDYSFEGMIEADFIPARNEKRRWYHAPLMNFRNGRELVHGLTEERPIDGPELGIVDGVTVRNFAIGFYNDIGAYTFGQVYANPNAPDVSKARFPEGTMVFKILFSAATPENFASPPGDILAGAPAWQIATQPTLPSGKPDTSKPGRLTTVRLLQMDVAVRDDRARPSGWVFGTFAFDTNAMDEPAWKRLRPVGLMWGNDPGYTPADQKKGKKLTESIVSDLIPSYAKEHLGWAGRVNGPVDNPKSACMSCHQTAQQPAHAPMIPPDDCTDTQKLLWFRTLALGDSFGVVPKGSCELAPDPSPMPASLDLSLQLALGVQSLSEGNVNPCTPPDVLGAPPAGPMEEYEIER